VLWWKLPRPAAVVFATRRRWREIGDALPPFIRSLEINRKKEEESRVKKKFCQKNRDRVVHFMPESPFSAFFFKIVKTTCGGGILIHGSKGNTPGGPLNLKTGGSGERKKDRTEGFNPILLN
jgi:hypothetical protein